MECNSINPLAGRSAQGKFPSLYDKPEVCNSLQTENHHQDVNEIKTELSEDADNDESKSITTMKPHNHETNEDFSSSTESVNKGPIHVVDTEVTANTNDPAGNANGKTISSSSSLGNLHTVSCSDESANTFDESDVIRFRNSFFEVTEELRIRRTLESENEERINTLITEKHELERKQEEEATRYNTLLEQHAEKESNIKKQYEDRLQQFEEEKAKLTLTSECNEKETKVLKDEVRALHLTKYHLEKTVKDQEHQMQLQTSARESYEFQLTELEQRCKELLKQCTEVSGVVDKVDTNVSTASRLHKKLMYANEHQTCLIDSYKTELDATRKDLVNVKANMAKQQDSVTAAEHDKGNKFDSLEKELRMQVELSRQLQSQLFDSRQENKAFVNSLKEAHKLLGKHVDSINKHIETEAAVQLELDDEKTERQATDASLKAEKEKSQALQEESDRQEKRWKEEEESLNHNLTVLQKEHDSLAQAHNSLEEMNSNWAQQNMEHIDLIQSLRLDMGNLRTQLDQAKDSLQSKANELNSRKEEHAKEIKSLQEQLTKIRGEQEDCLISIERWEEKYLNLETDSGDLRTKINELEEEAKRPESVDVPTQTLDFALVSKVPDRPAGSGLGVKALESEKTDVLDKIRTGQDFPNLCQESSLQGIQRNEFKKQELEIATCSKAPNPQRESLHNISSDETSQTQTETCEDDEGEPEYASDEEKNKSKNSESSFKEGAERSVCATTEGDSTKCNINTASNARESRSQGAIGAIKDVERENSATAAISNDELDAQESRDDTSTTGILKTPQNNSTNTGVQANSAVNADAVQDSPSRSKCKRVRFSIELSGSAREDVSSAKYVTNDIPALEEGKTVAEQIEFQELFSDEEADEVLGRGVSEQISQIEAKLKSNRLRTNRKRKYNPIV